MLPRIIYSYFRRYAINDITLPKKCYIKYVIDNYKYVTEVCECKYVCRFKSLTLTD